MKYLRLLLVGAFVLVAGTATTLFSSGTYYSEVSPFSAAFGLQADPLVLLEQANRAADLGEESPFSEDMQKQTAVAALKRRPLDSTATRLLGGSLSADYSQLPDKEALLLSEKISRRDRRTQAMLILQGAADGDPDIVFQHINRMLRVRPALVGEVAPQLLLIISDPRGREMVAEHADRDWFESFLNIAIARTTAPTDVAALVYAIDTSGQQVPADSENMGQLVGRLGENGFYDDALKIAGIAEFDLTLLEGFSPNLGNTQGDYAPLTWTLPDQRGGEVSLLDNGEMELSMDPGTRIEALSRVTNFRPGSFVLNLLPRELDGGGMLGEWALECHDGSAWSASWRSGWIDIEGGQDVSLPVQIGESCNVQRWKFQVQSDDGSRDVDLTFAIGFDAV